METTMYWFSDARHLDVFNLVLERVSQRFSLVMEILGDCSKEVRRFSRFFRNTRVKISQMMHTFSLSLEECCKGKHILLIQDSSELSFGFEPFQSNLGPVGNGTERGFFIHPVLAVDADTLYCEGLGHVEIYKRGDVLLSQERPFEDKLTYRWLNSVVQARKCCAGAAQHTVIADRVADIYEGLSGYQKQDLGFIIRADVNRRLYELEEKLEERIASWPVKHVYDVDLPRTKKRSAHTARLELRSGTIQIARPNRPVLRKSEHPPFLEFNVVEVHELQATVVGKEEPIHWILFTSLPVQTTELAMFVVRCYIHRWTIEQLFRTMKSKGLKVEDNMAEDFHSLSKIAVLGLMAAVKVIQMVAIRDGNLSIHANCTFSDQQIKILEKINPTLEGNTEKQKNPYPLKSMAYAAWVIARLGGWKGSPKERKPGPIRFLRGFQKFENFCQAASIFWDA